MNANELVKTPESGNVTPTNPESVPTPPESGNTPDANPANVADANPANSADSNPVNAPIFPDPAPVTDANPVSVADNGPADANPEPDYKTLYENVRRERDILLRNAELARQAPVRGVSGGAVALPADDFTRGFDSDTW